MTSQDDVPNGENKEWIMQMQRGNIESLTKSYKSQLLLLLITEHRIMVHWE